MTLAHSNDSLNQTRRTTSIRLDSSGGKPSAPWVLLEEAGMKPAEVAAMVTSYPALLTIPANRASPVVRWLSLRSGLSSKQVRHIHQDQEHGVCMRGFLHLHRSSPLGGFGSSSKPPVFFAFGSSEG